MFICGCFVFGCEKPKQREVVLYTSIDQPIAAPIVRDFEKRTGIHVTLVTDTEATKSVGLAERLRAEKDHPQADVWWGNEPFHTIRLADEGVLDEPYKSNGSRLRVIAVHESCDLPIKGIADLTNPKLKGRIAIARPTAGTTASHVAALYIAWGDDRTDSFLRALRANDVKLLGGNGPVAEAVGNGTVLAGLTDNDDVEAARANGGKLKMIVPDSDGPDALGVMRIPITMAVVHGARHPLDARQLIEYLQSSVAHAKLIEAKFAHPAADPDNGDAKPMTFDANKVADRMPGAMRRAANILEGRE